MGHVETCTELKKFFAALVKQPKSSVPLLDTINLQYDASVIPEASREVDTISNIYEQSNPHVPLLDAVNLPDDASVIPEASREADTTSSAHEQKKSVLDLPGDGLIVPEALVEVDNASICHEEGQPVVNLPHDSSVFPEAVKEVETVSNSHERRKPLVKIRVKQSAASSRAEDADNATVEKSQGGRYDADRGGSSSISVDAPQRNFTETVSVSNQNLEDVNSCHDVGSRVTASIGSAKLASDGDELQKELQCTADSSKVTVLSPPEDQLLPAIMRTNDEETESHKFASLQAISGIRNGLDSGLLVVENPHVRSKEKEKKKSKEKKRKRHDHKGSRDDPEYFERKRLKKEKKQKAKGIAKLQSGEATPSLVDLQNKSEKSRVRLESVSREAKTNVIEMYRMNEDSETRLAVEGGVQKLTPLELHSRKEDLVTKTATVQIKLGEPSGSKEVIKGMDTSVKGPEVGSSHKIKIKLKSRTGNKP